MDKAKIGVRLSTRWGVVWCDGTKKGETINQESDEGLGRGRVPPPRDPSMEAWTSK